MISRIVDTIISEKKHLCTLDASQLTAALYDLLHLRRAVNKPSARIPSRALSATDIFGPQIRVEKGWRREASRTPNKFVFERDGLYIEVSGDEVINDGNLLLPAIRDRFTPGFAALLSVNEPAQIGTRIYLSVERTETSHVGILIAKLLPRLTDRFVVKALTDAREYPRPDSITIFVGNEERDTILAAIDAPEIRNRLKAGNGNSLFAREERRGVAWLEGHSRASAGEERSKCVARAIRGLSDWKPDILVRSIEHEFRTAGIDPRDPHRLLGVEDINGH